MFKGPSFHHTGDFGPQAFDSQAVDGLAGSDAVEYVYISLWQFLFSSLSTL